MSWDEPTTTLHADDADPSQPEPLRANPNYPEPNKKQGDPLVALLREVVSGGA